MSRESCTLASLSRSPTTVRGLENPSPTLGLHLSFHACPHSTHAHPRCWQAWDVPNTMTLNFWCIHTLQSIPKHVPSGVSRPNLLPKLCPLMQVTNSSYLLGLTQVKPINNPNRLLLWFCFTFDQGSEHCICSSLFALLLFDIIWIYTTSRMCPCLGSTLKPQLSVKIEGLTIKKGKIA